MVRESPSRLRTEETTHIWIVNIETGIGTPLTFEGSVNQNPVWTSDNQSIVYRSVRDGNVGFYRKSADGTGEPELVLESDDLQVPADVQDDVLIFQESVGGTDVNISTVTLGGDGSTSEFLATPATEQSAQFSPDGQWISYSSIELGQTEPELYVRPYPLTEGGQRLISDGGGRAGVWSPDGGELYFWTTLQDGIRFMAVPIQYGPNVIPGRPQELFRVQNRFQTGPDSTTAPKYDITPDGERFVFVQQNASSPTDQSQPQINIVLNWFQELLERVPVD